MMGQHSHLPVHPGQLQFSIADIGWELTWKGAGPAKEEAWELYKQFLANPSRPAEVRLEVASGPVPQIAVSETVFEASRNHWRLCRAVGRFLFEIDDPREPHHPVWLAVMAPDLRSGIVYRRPDHDESGGSWSLACLMDPLVKLLLVNLLSQGRGALVHALGVSDQGAGFLFIGRSGAGKTTLANLYKPHPGVTILNDERVVVTKAGGRFWLSGTPWPGTGLTVSAHTVPLRKVFFLEHGESNRLITDRMISLHSLFFQQLFLPFWNGEALAFALRFVQDLLSEVPAHRLAFVNDARVIEFLREQVRDPAPSLHSRPRGVLWPEQ